MSEIDELVPVVLFAGVAVGWLIHWLIDQVYWRRRRICTKVEDQLKSANQGLETNNKHLRDRVSSFAAHETQMTELQRTLIARDEFISRLQIELGELGRDKPVPLDIDVVVNRLAGRLEVSQATRLESFRSELATSSVTSSTDANHAIHCDADVEVIVERLMERLEVANSATVTEFRQVVDKRYDAIEAKLDPNEFRPSFGDHADSHVTDSPQDGITHEPLENNLVGEPLADDLGPARNSLYSIEHQWSGTDEAWRAGGAWVLGGREGHPIVALDCAAQPDGDNFVGSVTYEGAGPVEFQAVKTGHNTYRVQDRSNAAGSPWEDAGTWLVGARWDHKLVAVEMISNDFGVTLQGTCQYMDEQALGIRGKAADGGIYLVDSAVDAQQTLWVLGASADEPLAMLQCTSGDDGRTFSGTFSYDGETTLDLRCARWAGNTYHAEGRSAENAPWETAGLWVIGSSDQDNVVAVELRLHDETRLSGPVTYEDSMIEIIDCYPTQAASGESGGFLDAVTDTAEVIT